jgi:charged multivesicular body protein 5
VQVLRQKKMYEQQRETLMNQQVNMESTRFTVESIQDTVQTVQALQAASKQMKSTMKTNKELDLSFIDKLQEDLADMAVRSKCRFLVPNRIHLQSPGQWHKTT